MPFLLSYGGEARAEIDFADQTEIWVEFDLAFGADALAAAGTIFFDVFGDTSEECLYLFDPGDLRLGNCNGSGGPYGITWTAEVFHNVKLHLNVVAGAITMTMKIDGVDVGAIDESGSAGVNWNGAIFGWLSGPGNGEVYFDNIKIGSGGEGSSDIFDADFETPGIVPPFTSNLVSTPPAASLRIVSAFGPPTFQHYDSVNAPFTHVGVAADSIGQDLIEKTTNLRSYAGLGTPISGQPGGPINQATLVKGADGKLWAVTTCYQSSRIINGSLIGGPLDNPFNGGFGPYVSYYDVGTDTWIQVDGPTADGGVGAIELDTSRAAFDAPGAVAAYGSDPPGLGVGDDVWIGFPQGADPTTISYDEINYARQTIDAWRYDGATWTQHTPTTIQTAAATGVGRVKIRIDPNDPSHPYMAWNEGPSGGTVVAQWNGSAWVALGGTYAITSLFYLDFRLDKNGDPILVTADGTDVIFVAWNGASWVTTSLSITDLGLNPTDYAGITIASTETLSDPHGSGSNLLQCCIKTIRQSDFMNVLYVFEYNTATNLAEPLDTDPVNGIFVDNFTFAGAGKLAFGWQLLDPGPGSNKAWLVQYPTNFAGNTLNAELWHYVPTCQTGWVKTVTYANFPTDDGLFGFQPNQGALHWLRDGSDFYAIHGAASFAHVYDTDHGAGIMQDNGGGGASVTTGDATADHTSYSRSTQALDLVGAPNTGNYSACDSGNFVGTSFQSGSYDVYVRARVNGGAGYGDFAFYYPFTSNPAGPCASLAAAPTPLAIGRWLDNGGDWEEKRIATSVTPGSTGTKFYRTAFGIGGGASSFDIDYIYFCKPGSRDFPPGGVTHSLTTLQAGRVKVFKTTLCEGCATADCAALAGIYLVPRIVG